MKITDSHQHLIDMERFSYSWCKGISALNRSFRLEDYLEAARDVDLHKSIHLEADADEPDMLDETKHILSLADQDNPIEGVVACGRPEKTDFKAYLDQIVSHPKLKGIRRVLHTQPDNLAESPVFIQNIRLLGQLGLSFDIVVLARQLPIAINLVKQCPGVSFILDHCGVPQVKERVLDPWRSYIKAISRLPNVACKVSGLVAYADPESWTGEDLRPFVDHVIECFGWDRVMFGSDWPVCTLAASYQQWVETLMFLTQDAGERNRRKLFQENAERVYRLSESALNQTG
ncbi:MAG: amidohydrolase family protein [Candidatus Binatia bacterium]